MKCGTLTPSARWRSSASPCSTMRRSMVFPRTFSQHPTLTMWPSTVCPTMWTALSHNFRTAAFPSAASAERSLTMPPLIIPIFTPRCSRWSTSPGPASHTPISGTAPLSPSPSRRPGWNPAWRWTVRWIAWTSWELCWMAAAMTGLPPAASRTSPAPPLPRAARRGKKRNACGRPFSMSWACPCSRSGNGPGLPDRSGRVSRKGRATYEKTARGRHPSMGAAGGPRLMGGGDHGLRLRGRHEPLWPAGAVHRFDGIPLCHRLDTPYPEIYADRPAPVRLCRRPVPLHQGEPAARRGTRQRPLG